MEKRIFLVAAFLKFLAFPHGQDCISLVRRNFWKNTLIRACNVNRVHSAQRIGLWAPGATDLTELQRSGPVESHSTAVTGKAIFFLTLFIFLRNDDDK